MGVIVKHRGWEDRHRENGPNSERKKERQMAQTEAAR